MIGFFNAVILMALMLLAGCGNPSGGTVLAPGHSPLLQPPASFDFTQVRSANDTVNIQWYPSIRASDYKLFMGTAANAVTTELTSCAVAREFYNCSVTGLTPGTTYYFQAKATNAVGSALTSVVPALSVGDFDFSAAPTFGDGFINIQWNTSLGATAYNVLYGTSSGSYFGQVNNVSSPYQLTGLTNGVRYYVRLVAVNNQNGYNLSTSEVNGLPFGPPPQPTGVALNATPGQMSLSWNSVPGATSYRVYRGTTSGSLSQIASGLTATSYVDNTITNGQTYFYTVEAFNTYISPQSAEVSARAISTFSLSALTATPAANQLTVSWGNATGAATYDVLYGTNPASLTSVATGVSSPYTITGLTGGTTYHVQVRANNTVGVGTSQLSSNQLSAIPVPALAAPTGLAASATPAQVILTWNSVAGASNYEVLRSTTSGSGYVSIQSGIMATTFTDSTVANGTAYYYVVRAFNGYNSPNSSEVGVKPIASFTISSVNPSNAAILVSWGGAAGADAFDVRWGTTSGSYSGLASGVTSPYTITGLAGSTNYYIVVRGRNAIGAGTNYQTSESAVITPPSAPAGLTISKSPGQLSLDWSDTTGASTYRVYRGTTSGTTTLLASGVGTSNYVDSTVTDGITYYYQVTAFNGSESVKSTEVAAQSISSFAITSTTAPSPSSITVNWPAVTGATAYDIRYGTTSGSYTQTLANQTSPATITGLAGGTNYYLIVVAKNAVGTGATQNSAEVSQTTPVGPPTGLTATVTDGQIQLNWIAMAGATSYKVYRSTTAGTYGAPLATGVGGTSYTDTSVVDGTRYYYVLRSFNGADSANSSEVTGKSIAAFSISSVVVNSSTQATVTFPTTAGGDTYDVRWGTTSGTYSQTASGVSSPYIISTLSPNTTYYFVVRANNAIGSGASRSTGELSAKTPTAAPTGLAIASTPGQHALSWTAVTGATSYKVHRSTTSGSGYSTIATGVAANSYNDATALDGTVYYYVVSAFNGADSANSAEASAKSISNFSITTAATSPTTIDVTWSAVTGADGYDVLWGTSTGSYSNSSLNRTSPFTISGLSANTNYYIVVRAKNSIGSGTTLNSSESLRKTPTAAPTGLVATASPGQIGLNWNAVTGATHFKVYRKLSSGGFTEGDLLADNVMTTAYADTTAANGTTYYYVVKAFNGSDSAFSSEVFKQPISSFNLSAVTATSFSTIDVSWANATGASSYDVLYGTTSGVPLGTLTGVTSPYTITGLSANTTYYVWVRANNTIGGGTSVNSNELNATTSPAAPASLVSSSITGQVNLSWSASGGATSYKIYRSPTSGSGYVNIASGVATTTYTDSTVTNGTNYYYVVRATNGVDSPNSNEVQARAIAAFSITSTSAPSTSSITVTWPNASGASTYDIRYGTASGTYSTTLTGVTSPHTISGLNSGTNYFIVVDGKNNLSNGGIATTAEVNQTTPIGPPTGVTASVSPGAINVSWNPAGGASSYKIYRSTTSGSYGAALATGIVATNYNDTTAVNGTTYYYVVKSFNGADSLDSAEVSGRPIANFTISSLTALSTSSLQVSWPVVTGAATYDVAWGTSSGSYSGSATGVTSPYSITGLSANTTYFVKVVAKNAIGAGASVDSTEANAKTPTAAPAGLVATASPGQIGLNWTAVTGATHYKVYRKLSSGGYVEGDLLADNVPSNAYLDTTVSNGTTYYYVVKAFNGSESAISSEVFKRPISSFSLSSLTALSATSLQATWANATGSASYDISYGTTSGVPLGTVTGVSSPYTLTGLTANTTYYVWIIAKNTIGGGSSVNSNELNTTTSTAAPTTLTASAVTGQINLSWTAAAGASTYRVYRSTTSGSGYSQIAAGIAGTSYSDTTVVNGTQYYYVVRGFNGTESANSNEATGQSIAAFTIASTTAPTATSIQVTWSNTAGATAYDVRYKIGAGAYTDINGVTSPYTITGLTGNTTYAIAVRARNSIGSGSSAQTPDVNQTTPVAPPTGLAASATPGQVNLTWNSVVGASSYKVFRSTTSGSGYASIATGVAATNYADTTVSNGTTYYYVVKSFNGADSVDSAEVSVQPIANFAAFSVTVNSSSQVTVNWTGGAGATAGAYTLKYGTASNTYSTTLTSQTSPRVITGLSTGTDYFFRVTAQNSVGAGTTVDSNEIQVATAFGAPTGLVAAATPGQIQLNWNTVSGASVYKVLRSTTSGGPYTEIASPGTNSYTDTGLTNGTSYFYVVRANNGADSANSNEAVARPISAFSFASASTASSTSATLTWANATGATSYDVLYGTSTGTYGTTITGVTSPHVVTGLNPNTNYFFRIQAKNTVGAGTSINSTEERSALTSPGAPTALAASSTPGSVSLTWTAPTSGATNYNVYRGTSPGGPYGTTVATAVTGTSTTDNTVTNGTAYYYTVKANNGSESVASNEAATKPIANFTITSTSGASPTTISVTFPNTAGGDTYDVRWGTGAGSYSNTATGVSSPYTITGLTSGTNYYIVVRANNAIGSGTSVQTPEVTQVTPLAPPGSLSATPSPGQVALSWPNVTGATSYKVFRSTTSGSGYVQIGTPGTNSYTDTGIVNGTQYYYVVRANNGADSANSVEATARPIGNFSITSTSSPSSSSITVNWANQTGATSYDIRYGTATGSYGAPVTGVTSPYTITGLNPNQNYYIVIVAKNTVGSGASVQSSESVQKTAPSAPTNLAATATPGQIALTWDAVSGVSGYKVYTSATSGGPYSLLASPGTNNYTHTGLTNGTSYFYVVRADNGSDSADSSEAAARPISSFTLSSAVVNSSSAITLTWTNATGASSYDVVYGTSSGNLTSTIASVSSSYQVTGLSPSTTYYFAVKAKNSVGAGTVFTSNELNAKTATVAPTISSAVVTTGQIALTWGTVSGATSYNIYRSTTSGSYGAALVTGLTGTTYNDTTVANGTQYYYTLKAVNGSESAASNEVTGLPIASFTVGSTTALSTTSIQITWANPTGTASADVLYSTTPGGPYTTITGASSPRTITGLSSGTTYYLRVVAKNTVGSGTSSQTAEVSQVTPVSPPSGLVATVNTGSIKLDWNIATGASGYRVYRSTTSGSGYSLVGSPSSNTFTDSTVANGTQYYYIVRSFNGVESANSSEVTGLPLASFSITSTSSPSASSVTVNWTGPTGSSAFDIKWGTTSNSYTGSAAGVTSPYTITGLSAGTTYFIRVVAKNSIGPGTSVDSAETSQLTALGAPTGLAASGAPTGVTLSWTAQPAASNFKIFRGTTSGSLSQIGTGSGTSYFDGTASNGVTYFYAISAFNGSDSALSSEVSVRSIGTFSLTAATAASASSINLTWGAATGAASYNVKYGTTTGVYLTTVLGVTSPYTLTGLTQNTTYFIAIEAVNSVGSGTTLLSNERNAKTGVGAPTGLVATATPGNVGLTWNAVSGASSYNVYRSTTSGSGYTQIASGVGTTSYPTDSVTNGTVYYYVVRAFNGIESVNSAEVSVKPISSFTIASATPQSATSISVSWGAATGADAYDVQYGTVSGTYSTTIANQTSPYIITGLTANTQYFIVVKAKNTQGAGTSVLTPEVNARTATAAITNLTASSSTSGQISLSWSNPGGATTYNIYRGTSPGVYSSLVTGHASTTYTDSTVINGTQYYYVVRASNGTEAANSNEATALPIGTFSISSTTATASSITVNWGAATGAATYDVRWGTTSGTYPNQALGVSSGHVITGLTANTQYYIVVRANNAIGGGATAQTPQVGQVTALGAPSGLAATGGTSQVVLNWSAVSGATSYKVYRSTTSGSYGATLATGITGLNYTDATAVNGTTYFYVITAFNGADSAYSNEVSSRPIATPSISSVIGNTSTSIQVSWTAATGAASYDLQWGTTSGVYPNTITGAVSPQAITGLTAGTTYFVRLVAKNAVGTGTSVNSAQASGTPNSPPVISAIAAQTMEADTSLPVNFTLSDANHVLTCTGSMSATSSNTTLLPNANIVFSGTMPNCVATITPAANQSGTATVTLTANDGITSTNQPFSLTVTPCTVAAINWIQQPTGMAAGNLFGTTPRVELRTAGGTLCQSNPDPVTLYVSTDTSELQDATITGVATAVAVNGIATFSGARMERAGTNFTVAASHGAVSSLNSNAFNVTALAASKIAFYQQPLTNDPNTTMIPSPSIRTTDTYGNFVPVSGISVAMSLQDNDEGATLSGTLNVNTNASGTAAFPMSINRLGSYFLRATPGNGWAVANSDFFDIIVITPQTTVATIDMLQGPVTSNNSTTPFPHTGTVIGSNYLDGTTTYTWRIVANNQHNGQNSTIRLQIGGTDVASIGIPKKTNNLELLSVTIPNGSVTPNALWSIKSESGNPTIYSSQIIIQQTNAKRSQAWIPLFSIDNASTGFVNVTSTTPVASPEMNFPSFAWDKTDYRDLNGITLGFSGYASGGSACAALYNKDSNTRIGGELCTTNASMSHLTLDIPKALMPTTANIEVRVRNTGGTTVVGKAGIYVRMVNITKVKQIQRNAGAGVLTAGKFFEEQRVSSFRNGYGIAFTGSRINEFVECQAKGLPGVGSFQYRNHGNNTTGTGGTTAISASTMNFSSSSYTSIIAGPLATTNNNYQLIQYTHSSGSLELSHCIYSIEADYVPL